MYRDGGSLEGVWVTSENTEWAVCLKNDNKKPASLPFEDRIFMLHNLTLSQCANENKMGKDINRFQAIMNLFSESLLQSNKQQLPSRMRKLMLALHKGHY